MPSIGCVIVNYNNKRYLQQCVESVLAQTLPVSEIIISDDCSTDGSRELISSIASNYRNIRPIFRESNLGVGANRDLAIRDAKTEFITTLDSDDYFSTNKLQAEYDCLQQGYDVAFSDVLLIDEKRKSTIRLDLSIFPGRDKKERMKWLTLRKLPIPRDMLLSRNLYLDAGGFRHGINLYEDWDFKIRLSSLSRKWGYSGETGTSFRRSGEGLSSVSRFKHYKRMFKILCMNKNMIINEIGLGGYMLALIKPVMRSIKTGITGH